MRRPSKKLAVAIAAAGIVAIGGGAALAYWTSTGTGTGSGGTNGSAEVVTITQTSPVTGMGPGVAPQALSGTFTTAHPAFVGQVTASVSSTNKTGCTSADFTIVQPTATDAEVTSASTWSGGSIVFKNTTANQDACQGAIVTLAYSSN
jgi:hypothetical protein